MAGPLAGIRVLEFSQVIAAPFAGQILADLGADVLKVEPPGGESWRLQTAFAPTESKTFQCLNRGKRSITLSLDRPESQAIVHRLVAEMDVVLINYRPDAPAKFRIDYDTLRAIRTDLVYVDLTAFGRRGAWANRPGYDGAVQAISGLMAAEGKTRPGEGSPATIASSAIADYSSGYVLADAVISGLYHRARTGEGQMIECSLLASALNLQPHVVMEHPVADAPVRNPGRDERRRLASEGAAYTELLAVRRAGDPHNIYHRAYLTADGGLVVAAETPAEMDCAEALFGFAAGEADDKTVRALEQKLESGTTADWLRQLDARSIPAAPLQFTEEMTTHPQVLANDWIVSLEHEVTGPQTQIRLPLRFSKSSLDEPAASPPLGRDTIDVLSAMGFSNAEIDDLHERGAI